MLAMILALTVAPAPAPKPAFEVTLKIDARKNVHDEKFATVEIKNNTEKDLDMRTNLPFGPLVFLDTEILDANKKRISAERYWAMISSPYSPDDTRSAGVIPAGKSLAVPVRLFLSVDEKNRAAGKYTCRVRFRYDKINEVSGWVPVEVTEETLKRP
jgi:hypothetical protein